MVTEQARLHAVPIETGRYPKDKWKTETTRYSNDDGSGDAGVNPVGPRLRIRDHRRRLNTPFGLQHLITAWDSASRRKPELGDHHQ